MHGNSLGVVLSSGGLAAAERSEGSVCEPERSAAAAKAGADSGAASRPDPEVVAKAKRRTYTAEYKQRILEEADTAAATRGALGALLRREGLYYSLLTTWRQNEPAVFAKRWPHDGADQKQSTTRRRRKSEATPSGRPIDRKTPQSGDHHRRSKKR